MRERKKKKWRGRKRGRKTVRDGKRGKHLTHDVIIRFYVEFCKFETERSKEVEL